MPFVVGVRPLKNVIRRDNRFMSVINIIEAFSKYLSNMKVDKLYKYESFVHNLRSIGERKKNIMTDSP